MPSSAGIQALTLVRFGIAEPMPTNPICSRCGDRWIEHTIECRCRNETMDQFNTACSSAQQEGATSPGSARQATPPQVIKLGADPEFAIFNSAGFVGASNVINPASMNSRLGVDGSSTTGEMRPEAGNPEDVLNSLDSIITTAYTTLPDFDLYSGAFKQVPMGGHIHFSGIPQSAEFLGKLDQFITLPLREVSSARRWQHTHYGRLSEHRLQPHGFEYRSPCSWISHPKIALGVLTISYVLAKANQDGSMNAISTTEALLNKAKASERINIIEFYGILDRMKKKGVSMEDIEIFQAWRKKPIAEASSEVVPHLVYRFADSANLIAIRDILARNREYGVAPCSPEYVMNIRSLVNTSSIYHDSCIQVCPSFRQYLNNVNVIQGGHIYENGLNGMIGLSNNILTNPQKAATILKYIRYHYRRSTSGSRTKEFMKVVEGE